MQIRVLGILFVFSGFVNQDVETRGIRISLHDGGKLLFVKSQNRLYCLTKVVQQLFRGLAKNHTLARLFARRSPTLFGTHFRLPGLRDRESTRTSIPDGQQVLDFQYR